MDVSSHGLLEFRTVSGGRVSLPLLELLDSSEIEGTTIFEVRGAEITAFELSCARLCSRRSFSVAPGSERRDSTRRSSRRRRRRGRARGGPLAPKLSMTLDCARRCW